MKLTEAHPNDLENKGDRALAKLARIARGDVYHGGARAMMIAKRLSRSPLPFGDVVSQAYASSNGTARDYLPYECGECGTVHLGQDAAFGCCAMDEVWLDLSEEIE